MLKGKILYNDEHIGQVLYNVVAVDNYETTHIIVENNNSETLDNVSKGLLCFDKHIEDGRLYNPYKEVASLFRKLEVSRSNKCKTNITNKVMATRISALIKYAISEAGKAKNYEFEMKSLEFNTERKVNIGELGYVSLSAGLLKEMAIKTKYVSIFLEDVGETPTEYQGSFKGIKQKDNFGNIISTTPVKTYGYKLDEEILGFQYESKVASAPASSFGMYQTVEEVLDAHSDKSIKWMQNRKYVVVTDDMLPSIMQEFYEYDGHIAFDTETTGLKITFKSRTGEGDQLVGVVLSKEKGTGYYFPLQQKRFANLCGGDHYYFMERYMKKLLETKKIVVHNASFDWKVAYIYGINTNVVYDTNTALSITERYRIGKTFRTALKSVVKLYFGWDMLDLKDFAVNGNFGTDFTFADLPYDLVAKYAPADGDMTLTLFEYIETIGLLDKANARTVFADELVFSKAVGYSEFYGYKINTDNIPVMEESLEKDIERLTVELQEWGGKDFNPSSPSQVSKIIYDDLGVEDISGNRSTAKDLLKPIAKEEDANGNPKYPFVSKLLEYRDYTKLYTGFIKRIHDFATDDGFINPEVKQFGADTGRTSAKDPNYQSYNDVIKKNIVPRKGYVMFDCDFSQIEYRVLASMAQQWSLMEEFDDVDMDYHTYQASRMFNIDYALVPKDLRQQSKGINFGLPYGMGDPSLGKAIFGERTKENTAKASKLRKKFFEGQEAIEQFFLRVRNEGVAKGYTSTLFGRRRYYDKNIYNEAAIRRQAGNHVIQGSAADIYKRAVVRLFQRIEKEGWLGKVLFNAFVHDELLCEVHESIDLYYFFKAWREEFQVPIDNFCTLFAGAGVGYSWYEAKKQDLTPYFIDEIIEIADKKDYVWDEDTDKFIMWTNNAFFNHKKNRVKSYIINPNNQNKPFNPTINALCNETVTEDIITWVKEQGVDDTLTQLTRYDYVEPLPQPLVEEKKGKLTMAWKSKKINDYLKAFCVINDLDYTKVSIPELDETPKAEKQEKAVLEEYKPDEYTIYDKVYRTGFFLEDGEDDYGEEVKEIAYLTQRPLMYNGIQTDTVNILFNEGVFEKGNKGYHIYFVDEGKKQVLQTEYSIQYRNLGRLREVYNFATNLLVR